MEARSRLAPSREVRPTGRYSSAPALARSAPPSGGGKWKVSEQGGTQPRWSRDGKEIFFVEQDTLITASVTASPSFSVGAAERLFTDPNLAFFTPLQMYDVSADGQRFVLVDNTEDPQYTIHVVQNWYEEFRNREQD